MKNSMDKQAWDKYMNLYSLSLRDLKEFSQTMLAIPSEEWSKDYDSLVDMRIRDMKDECELREQDIEEERQSIEGAKKQIAEYEKEIKKCHDSLAVFEKLRKAIDQKHKSWKLQ